MPFPQYGLGSGGQIPSCLHPTVSFLRGTTDYSSSTRLYPCMSLSISPFSDTQTFQYSLETYSPSLAKFPTSSVTTPWPNESQFSPEDTASPLQHSHLGDIFSLLNLFPIYDFPKSSPSELFPGQQTHLLTYLNTSTSVLGSQYHPPVPKTNQEFFPPNPLLPLSFSARYCSVTFLATHPPSYTTSRVKILTLLVLSLPLCNSSEILNQLQNSILDLTRFHLQESSLLGSWHTFLNHLSVSHFASPQQPGWSTQNFRPWCCSAQNSCKASRCTPAKSKSVKGSLRP